MLPRLDSTKGFLPRRLTLSGGIEAFAGPFVAIVMLGLAVFAFDRPLAPRYVILGVIAFSLAFPGGIGLHDDLRTVVRKVVGDWLFFVLTMSLVGWATGYIDHYHRPVLVAWAVATPLAQLCVHILLQRCLPDVMVRAVRRRRVVIAGLNPVSLQVEQQFVENPYLHADVVGFFDDRAVKRVGGPSNARVLGTLADLPHFVKLERIDQVYVALPMAAQKRTLALLDELKDTTASIYFVPDIFVTDLIQGQVANVGPIPVLAVCDTPFHGARGPVKRAMDILVATCVMLILSPLLLALAIAVKLSSPGPVIFKQRRYGLDGREIVVYKFRSMTALDDGPSVVQATRGDARITSLGALMRRTSLDELPQLMNVLQGRMSIVGPRPHAVAHNETYRKLVKGYMLRHKVRPGITGWAQVSGYRGETETVEKMAKRIECDLEYLRNWSLGFDLWIMFRTAALLLRDRHAY